MPLLRIPMFYIPIYVLQVRTTCTRIWDNQFGKGRTFNSRILNLCHVYDFSCCCGDITLIVYKLINVTLIVYETLE